jgi:fructose-1,6-bisphosphatase-3
MQKAAAILQFKLEGQVIAKNPSFDMDGRRLLHQMDLRAKDVAIGGKPYPLRDVHFPTLDASDPYRLTDAESACIERIRSSFMASQRLWDHVRFMVDRGGMYLIRDQHLIFHGCVPVNQAGEPLPMTIDGAPRRGRALFEALERVVARATEHPTEPDLDLLFYLWCGPRSPLFGKDKITTFERDLVANEEVQVEVKNPYFRLLHETAFCRRILEDFGVDPELGMIVNGHVPVKVEQGESPGKRSGQAVTIDGAFSEAYGDHGYTLVLDAQGTRLALHHHFESVAAAVEQGIDIIPTVSELRRFEPPRTLGDTERGRICRSRIALMKQLSDRHSG